MREDRRVCLACQAPNALEAHWCARCLAPFEAGATERAITPPPRSVAPPPPVLSAPNHRIGGLERSEGSGRSLSEMLNGNVSSVPAARLFRAAASLVLVVVMLTGFQNARGGTSHRIAEGTMDPRGFAFMGVDRDSGEPVRYDACAPVHYVVNPANAPAGGIEDVHAAFEMTAEVSGLRFIYDGETDEAPTHDREVYQPDRYGDRWAPVLIAWSPGPPPLSTGGASGDRIVGVGGSSVNLNDDDRPIYLSGQAVFDGTADLAQGFGGRTWGQVILHEIGHVVGLDHVGDPRSVMNDRVGLRPASWGPGDRAGLWKLGVGSPCIPAPRP